MMITLLVLFMAVSLFMGMIGFAIEILFHPIRSLKKVIQTCFAVGLILALVIIL